MVIFGKVGSWDQRKDRMESENDVGAMVWLDWILNFEPHQS